MTKYNYLFKGHRKIKDGDIILLDGVEYVVLGFHLVQYKGNGMGIGFGSLFDEGYINIFYVEENKYLQGINNADVKVVMLSKLLGYKIVGSKEKNELERWLLKLKIANKNNNAIGGMAYSYLFDDIETRESIKDSLEGKIIKYKYTFASDISGVIAAIMIGLWGVALIVDMSKRVDLEMIYIIIGVLGFILIIVRRLFLKEQYTTSKPKKEDKRKRHDKI